MSNSIYHPSFLLFQLATATLFLRPAEMFEPLAEAPIYEGLILACLCLGAADFQHHFSKRMLAWQPVTLCVVGILFAIVMSHLSHMYLGGVSESATFFVKTLIYYGLLITTVNTASRIKAFAWTVALCGSLMVFLCVLDFYGIQDFVFIEQLEDLDKLDDEGERLTIWRMRGTGIFQDPNDLAMVIVACGVLCTYFLFDKSRHVLRYLWSVPLGVLVLGLLSTRSRGGLLAACGAVMVMLMFRMGTKTALVLGVLGVCTLPFLAGRQGEIDLEEGTAGERIEMWREGFDALKGPDLIFGIGQGMYADLAGLVAHNSFVHAYVELGIVGGTLFFGAFFFVGLQLFRMGFKEYAPSQYELIRFRPYMAAMVAGWCVSMFSLSRCYVVPTYMVLGFAAAYLNMIAISTIPQEPLAIWNRWQATKLAVASGATFIGLYAFTVIFA